ncbi:MAG: alpha-L-rhamnosidase C-terminal domain-containing protein [Verrucomicrobiota bacterium]
MKPVPSGRAMLCVGVLGLSLCRAINPQLIAAALPPGIPAEVQARAEASPLRSWFLSPVRIVWQSEQGVQNAGALLQPKPGQAVLQEPLPTCSLTASSNGTAGILLDFGVEVNATIELFTTMAANQTPAPVRVRFGESAAEAMAELGGKQNAQNDHALRDEVVNLPWLGRKTVGPSGFRFVRLDAVDPKLPVVLSQVRAVLTMRDLPYVGSFRCNDERLNRIWQVGAYTVQLNMQEYLWDGIKRDRLVWLGDMHPEVSTINAVFGYNEVVPRSLDLIRQVTPPTEWMNGISSYSMWWVLIQEDWWMHHGNRQYLEAQQDYLAKLLRHLATFVNADGSEKLDGMRFLDWPTSESKSAVHEGLQAMLLLTMESGARLSDTLGDKDTAKLCRETVVKLRQHQPESSGRKSPAALLALAGVRSPKEVADQVLKANGPSDLSTFYGFYVLQALAKSGDVNTALDFISTYWGTMLDFGATTFWEDFDLAWTNNAARIDGLVPPDKKDIHGDYGAYCYLGFRHSLCHGWASGPTAWLSQHVLGVTPLEPGFKRVRIVPQLGRLQWVEGSYPTPLGPIKVRHERLADGGIKSDLQAPAGITVERK